MKLKSLHGKALALALAAAAPAARAQVQLFIKIGGLEGESLDIAHPGESVVVAWNWGLSKPASRDQAASPLSMQDFTFVKAFDKSSPRLMQACADGKPFSRAVLTLRKQGDRAVEFARIVLEEVRVTGQQVDFSAQEDARLESINLNFARVGVEYFTILATGERGERSEFALDTIRNRPGGVTFTDPSGGTDSDEDGMPDVWERQFGLDPAVKDAALDKDRDGATNLEEFVAGTNPADANIVFRSTLSLVPGGRTATLSWSSTPGKTYRVLAADKLGGAFGLVTTVPASDGASTTATLPAVSINRFFRVEVVP